MEIKMKIIFLISLILLLVISPVLAGNISVSIEDVGQRYIAWNWSELSNVTSISFDGIIQNNFDTSSNSIIFSNLTPYSQHILKVYSDIDSGENITYTLPETIVQTEQEHFFGVINLYILFVIALICIGIAVFVPIVGVGACIFALIGLLTSVNNSFVMGFLFFIALCAGIIECMTT
jgi:hypothetical protein